MLRPTTTQIVLQAVLPTATGERNEWPGRFTRPVERLNARYRQLAEEYAHVTFNDCGDLFIQVPSLPQLLPLHHCNSADFKLITFSTPMLATRKSQKDNNTPGQ